MSGPRGIFTQKDYDSGAAFVDGRYCPIEFACIPISDLGFMQADAVYEKLTVYSGRYFRKSSHFERFAESCKKFELINPYSNAQMTTIFNNLLSLANLRNAGLWWCVTRGAAKSYDNQDRADPGLYRNCFYAKVDNYTSIASRSQSISGLNLSICKTYHRIPKDSVDPEAKNFHWQDMKLSLFEARRGGYDWTVLTDDQGYLTEAPGANIFIIKDGCLLSPDRGCLRGITRDSVFQIASKIGIEVSMCRIQSKDCLAADDAFLTSSAGGVMPVNSIDGVSLGKSEGPGEISRLIRREYWKLMREEEYTEPVRYKTFFS